MSVSKEWMASDPHDPEMTAAFVEGRLDARDRALVTAHAAECLECREVIAALTSAAGPELPGVVRVDAAERAGWGPRYLLPLAATIAIGTVAGVLVLRLNDAPSRPAAPPPAPAPEGSASVPAPKPLPPSASPVPSAPAERQPVTRPAPPEQVDERLLPRRSGERVIGEKVFRLVAGEWTDTSYDPVAGLPVVEVRTPAERDALLARFPSLRPFAALGPTVLVVQDGTVYRFR